MDDVANLISAQVDLLWSVTLALLIAEVFLLAKFFAGELGKLSKFSKSLLYISIVCLAGSMFFGYLTYGAAVEVVTLNALQKPVDQSLKDAGFSALLQFAGFAAGLATFLWAFFLNAKSFGKAANGK